MTRAIAERLIQRFLLDFAIWPVEEDVEFVVDAETALFELAAAVGFTTVIAKMLKPGEVAL